MTDEFFRELDQKLSAQKTAQGKAQEQKDERLERSIAAVREARAVAAEYVDGLKQRGIQAEVKGHDEYFSFSLEHSNGDKVSLGFGVDLKTKFLEMRGHYIDEYGRPYGATKPITNSSEWTSKSYRRAIEEFINDYVRGEDRRAR